MTPWDFLVSPLKLTVFRVRVKTALTEMDTGARRLEVLHAEQESSLTEYRNLSAKMSRAYLCIGQKSDSQTTGTSQWKYQVQDRESR